MWELGAGKRRMRRVLGILAAAGTLALAGVATGAHAQSAQSKAQGQTYSLQQQDVWSNGAASRSLQWNGKGRWGLKLDYQQPTNRDLQWNDVDAGVNFKLNSRLRLGAAVNVGQGGDQPRMVTPDEKPQPRVRLETLFRF